MGGPVTTRSWTRASDGMSWRCAPWTIAKVTVKGQDRYELRHDESMDCKASKDSLNEACEAARRAENARAHLGEND
jgi:hypothetical protein